MSRRPVRITTEHVEKNIRHQREVEQQRRELAAFGNENANLMSVAAAQGRIEAQRRLTQQQISRTEQMYDEQLRKQEYDKKFRELTIMQNQALATELNKEAADEERHRREIQKICEDAPELRELERVLKIAYLNKERAVQYEEKIALAMKEQERIQAIEDEMEAERLRSMRAESSKDQEKRRAFAQQRAVLQKQIDEKRARLAEAKAQIEKEKNMVDDIVRRINEEDEQDYQKRKEKQRQTAEMVKAFELQRARELAEARRKAEEEEQRIRDYQRRNEGVAAKKQAKKEEEDRIFAQIVEETERKRKEEEEFNMLRDMLWEEELEAKRAQDTLQRQMKAHQMKEEMMQANSEIQKYKQLQRLKDAEKEAQLVAIMRAKFAEDEARERAEEEARRRIKVQHMHHIADQRMERQQLYAQEREAEQRELQRQREIEDYRKRVVQEARRRLLEEHAERLRGYLPSKVFETKEEMEEFRTRNML
eukprot:gene32437-39225_t